MKTHQEIKTGNMKNSSLAGKLLGNSRWPEETLRGLLSRIMSEWESTFKKIKIDLNKQNFLIRQVKNPGRYLRN